MKRIRTMSGQPVAAGRRPQRVGPRRWLFVAVLCAATVAGCSSASTGQTSPDAVIETVRDVAGPELAVYRSQVLVKDADDGSFRWLPIVVACRPQGGCRVIAPDGADYPDLRTFVDDTKLVNRGDSVTGNANVASPAEAVRTETFVKRPYPPWARYALVGALLLGLPLVVVLLIRSTRRRRADQQRLLRTWQPTQGPE